MGREQRRDALRIAIRQHLDNIRADHIRAGKEPNGHEGFGGGEAADAGCAGARREGRIDAVDVE